MAVLTYDEIGTSHLRRRKRRICAVEGCGTVLNSYNKGPYCSAHQAKRLLAKLDREAAKVFDVKHKRYFQLTNWEDNVKELENLGLGYRFRRIKMKFQGKKKMYAVFVKD